MVSLFSVFCFVEQGSRGEFCLCSLRVWWKWSKWVISASLNTCRCNCVSWTSWLARGPGSRASSPESTHFYRKYTILLMFWSISKEKIIANSGTCQLVKEEEEEKKKKNWAPDCVTFQLVVVRVKLWITDFRHWFNCIHQNLWKWRMEYESGRLLGLCVTVQNALFANRHSYTHCLGQRFLTFFIRRAP